MYRRKRIKEEALIYILIIMLILVFILTGLNRDIRNMFNQIQERMLTIKDKKITFNNIETEKYINNLKIEINKLKELNNLNEDSDYKCINATVIYRDPTYWYNTITINKGLKDGIKNNSMVINNKGIIGIIKETLNNSSTVSLMTNIDNKKKITVGINYNDEIVYGLINKYDFNSNELIINEITSDIELVDKMEAFTTNFTNTFIEGISIGKVKEIKKDTNGLSNIALVTPHTNFNDIKYVCVIEK